MKDFTDIFIEYDEQEEWMNTEELPECDNDEGCAKEWAGKCHSLNKCKYQSKEKTDE